MTELELRELLAKRFNTLPTHCSTEFSPGSEDISERQRLLYVFSRRLEHLKGLDALNERQKEMLHEIRNFITQLESISDEEQLYSWNATISGKGWGGWCTGKRIIFAVESISS